MKHAYLSLPVAAATLGAMSGMRSMSALAVLSVHLARGPKRWRARGMTRLLGSPGAAVTLTALSLGEFIADKLPFVPPRTEPASLVARVASGAAVGAAVAGQHRRTMIAHAMIGATAAAMLTKGAFRARRALARKLRVPDFAIALLEDAVVLSSGAAIVTALRRRRRLMSVRSRLISAIRRS